MKPRPDRAEQAPEPAQTVELRRAFQQGDRRAFEELVRPELDLLYTLCVRVLGRAADAEEVAQDALERALRAHKSYDPERPFRAWLLAIGLNRCRDRMRGPWWRRVLRFEQAAPQSIPSCHELLEGLDVDAKVRAALATLPPLYREALALYHLDDLGYGEMSAILGASTAALKQRVRRGREMLREAMQTMYPELAIARTGDREGVVTPWYDWPDSPERLEQPH